MSLKQTKHGSPGTRAPRGGGGKKSGESIKGKPESDRTHNENVVRRLYELFQDIFDYDVVASVCHTCQWDATKATEALMVLGDAAHVKKQKNLKGSKGDVNKNKPKSLPSTLKPTKSENDKGNSMYAMPNSLRTNPAHVSTSSLSSGQVWQRHYKSKPQSPGLLTMIPPYSKEGSKLKKSGSARSLHGQSTQSKSWESPEVKQASSTVKRIQHLVQNGVKVLILMRGLPGSGKTHLAQIVVNLVTNGNELGQHIFSTDDYFIMLGRGNYAYDFHQLPLAHHWNQRRVFEALRRATNPVVVDNTHTQAWEMEPYVSMAVSQGYLIEVLEPVTPWRLKEAELAKRNVHSVPREKIHQMLERYERGWTGEKLIQLFGLNYAPCGSAHVAQELTTYSNSPLTQHRQQSVIDTPEKPKRKKNSPKRKDRKHMPGVEITEDKEKQLEELNQLFAEYGKKMDPLSKKKVLESGVPISEVVSRMRKLQGNILPLPKSNVYPPTIPEKEGAGTSRLDEVVKSLPNYKPIPRESPCESVEPDTMSSSNASETSECESDNEAESRKTGAIKSFFNYRGSGPLGDTQDIWKDLSDVTKGRAKDQKRSGGSSKPQSGITSSQEELSIIDYELSTNPACSSQEELSLLDYDDEYGNKKAKEGSSSSSEEQETQLLTLQESLREVLIDSYEKRKQQEEQAEKSLTQVPEQKDLKNNPESDSSSAVPAPEQIDGLANALNKRLEDIHIKENSVDNSSKESGFVDYLLKRCDANDAAASEDKMLTFDGNTQTKKSPDLEQVPLPSIPSGLDTEKIKATPSHAQKPSGKKETHDENKKSWESPKQKDQKPEIQPKPERPLSGLLGAIKKTGIQRDKSPEELLRSVELSWSSIPFTSSWEEINKKAAEQKAPQHQHQQQPKHQRKATTKTDSSTNTKHSDFNLWKDDKTDLVKLTTQNRNINQGLKVEREFPHYATECPMLDKGSMTSDLDEYETVPMDAGLEMLSGMFPDILPEDLADVLEKCKGNINWAAELLLESPHNVETTLDRKSSDEGIGAAAAANTPSFSKIPDNLVISDGKKTIKRRKDRKSAPSELSLLLKKQIEDGIHINEECYNEKTLFLKMLRHGEINPDKNPVQQTSVDPGQGQPPISPRDYVPEEVIPPAEHNQEEEEEEEETIPMKIDPDFFCQLALHFGHFVELDQPENHASAAVVNIPVSLGYQIYGHWLETVNRQIEEMQAAYDNMIKEDELLAQTLQEQEHSQHKPDLREIMDMELAMAVYKQDEEQSRAIYEDTMACKLSKQLLFESYPNIDQKVLLDLFRMQGYSFHKTVELLDSQKVDSPKTVIAPELLQAYQSKLIEEAKQETAKEKTENLRKPIVVVKQATGKKCPVGSGGDSKDILVVNPAEFRQNMTLLQKRRYDCCRQAQEAFRKKSYSVASYYSHLASLYKERIAQMNKKYTSWDLFDEKRSESPPRSLDLHFLFVNEALRVVDLFLDYHIKELIRRNVNSIDLNLITGRGLKSRSQKPKIKPAIKKRLDQRKLPYIEQNPGMLKVTVRKSDNLSESS